MLDISTGPILWTILNFIILLLLLRAVAWKPITKALEAREESINDSLNRAEVAREEAHRILSSNQEAQEKAEAEAQRLLRESREYADRVKEEAMSKAEEESKRLLEQARKEIERSKQEALNELRSEVASLAIGASEKILREKIDADKQQTLIDEYLGQAAQKN